MDDIRPLREDLALAKLLGHMFHDGPMVAKRPTTGAWIAPETEPLQA